MLASLSEELVPFDGEPWVDLRNCWKILGYYYFVADIRLKFGACTDIIIFDLDILLTCSGSGLRLVSYEVEWS